MLKGEFSIYVYLLDEEGLHVYDQKVIPSAFSIETAEYRFGLLEIEHRWESSSPAASEAAAGGGARVVSAGG